MIQVYPLALPTINLNVFQGLTNQIGNVDSKSISPADKFRLLVDEISGEALSHLYATFYIQLPSPILAELMTVIPFREFKITADVDGMNAYVLVSGSLQKWGDFASSYNRGNAFVNSVQSQVRKALHGIYPIHEVHYPEDGSRRLQESNPQRR